MILQQDTQIQTAICQPSFQINIFSTAKKKKNYDFFFLFQAAAKLFALEEFSLNKLREKITWSCPGQSKD